VAVRKSPCVAGPRSFGGTTVLDGIETIPTGIATAVPVLSAGRT
jgi:hypothetical protein